MKVSLCLIWLFAPSVLWRQKGFTFMRRKSVLKQTSSFSSKPRESPSATWHLISTLEALPRVSSVVKRGRLIDWSTPREQRRRKRLVLPGLPTRKDSDG